jgi:iron-sulfur cluster repair protein YtfE (RIC family)
MEHLKKLIEQCEQHIAWQMANQDRPMFPGIMEILNMTLMVEIAKLVLEHKNADRIQGS